MQNNVELLAQFERAEEDQNMDMLTFCIRSLIVQAASNRTVYLSALTVCFALEYKKKCPLYPVCFD